MNAGARQTQESQRWENPETQRETERQTVTKTDHDRDREQEERKEQRLRPRERKREKWTKVQRWRETETTGRKVPRDETGKGGAGRTCSQRSESQGLVA